MFKISSLFYQSMLQALALLIVCHGGVAEAQNSGSWHVELSSDGSKPDQRHEAGYVRVGNKFYLIGGRGVKDVNIYDPATQQWTDGDKPPFEIHHFQPVEYQGKIYSICAMTGGYPNETPIPNIMIYDPAADQWSTGDSIPVNRRRGSAGVVVHNDTFYIVSGIQNGHQSGHVPWLDYYVPATGNWGTLPDAPRSRDHFQATYHSGKIFALGGRTSIASQNVFGNTISEVDVYDMATQQWSTLSQNLPTERAGTFNAVLGNEILVMGGESLAQNTAHDETEALDVTTLGWRTLSPLLQGRHGTGAAFWNDTLYSASGSGGRGGGPELTTQEYFTFGITPPVNQAPTLSATADQSHKEGDMVSLQLQATDPDNDPLQYTASNLPAGLSIDSSSGLISGTITSGAAASSPYQVIFQVQDSIHPAIEDTVNWDITTPTIALPPFADAPFLKAYPLPLIGKYLTLELFEVPRDPFQVILWSIQAELLYEEQFIGEQVLELDFSEVPLPKGIYFLEVRNIQAQTMWLRVLKL